MPTDDRPLDQPPSALIAMPGTGSDDDFVRRAFGPAAARLGVELIAPAPTADLVAGHRRALDAALDRHRRVVVGGVSIGAAIAVEWALAVGPHRCAGVWAALPAWSGSPDGSLAAASARATAQALAEDGLEATVEAMVASSPDWLADELSRSWRHLHPDLIPQLTDAARYRAPELAEMAELRVPLAVVAASDDPLHPMAVARAWCAAAPRSALLEVTLTGWGTDASLLGNSCADGWLALTAR